MKAVHNISYGLYVLSANTEKQNACIINTLMQVTSTNPAIISVTANKDNYTTFQIKKTIKKDYQYDYLCLQFCQ